MPPKKQNNSDTGASLKKKNANSRSSNTSTQPEGATVSQAGHSHRFTLKFSSSDDDKYIIKCNQPCTVLEAIKSDEIYKKMIKSADENIIIQLGKEDKESILPTHFPCSCITHGESLIISCKSEKVEQTQDRDKTVYPRDEYSVFYIDTVGGKDTKTKTLFRSSFVKKFKRLCVYGKKGMTVEEALKRDGRFIDDLGEFTLSHNDNPNMKTTRRQPVDPLDQKEFKICLPRKKKTKEKDEKQQGDREQQGQNETRSVSEVAKQSGISVKGVVEKVDNTEEIYCQMCEQFPCLKELMESRFPGDSYQKELDLRKENFGKIQQAFSEVHRVRKLLRLGESVCKVVVQDVCTGTGFVLFDGFILTSAHLFKGYFEEKNLQDGVEVFALFNYDDPEPNTNYYCFTAKTTFIDIDFELDYAVLELNPEAVKPNQQTIASRCHQVPPGLLHIFGPPPTNGEACLIGHPAGEVKRMDPTCIIQKEMRKQAVNDHLHPYKDHMFIVHSVSQVIKDQGIENIMMGGNKADKVGTYNTFMYHGASGSPVFDGLCRVFGLHTGGYTYGFPNHTKSVIEYAIPVLTIFEKLVGNLKESGNKELLNRVKTAAKENKSLQKILNTEMEDAEMQVEE